MNNSKGTVNVCVTLVCQVFYPDSQSTSQLLTDLCTRLARRGFDIEVLSGYPAMVVGKEKGSPVPASESVHGVRIRRSGGRFNFKKNLFLRVLHYTMYLMGTSLKLFGVRRRDIVLGVTNPPFMPVWMWLASKVFRFRYQLMLQDLFPDGLVALGDLTRRNPVTRLWQWANRRSFANAERILVLGRDMGEKITACYGVPPEKIEYVPHWSVYEQETPRKPETTELWRRLKLGNAFVVQYSGNMGLWHDMETLVRAAARLQDECPEVRFLFIGGGRREGGAKKLAEDLGCTNIIWLPFQPKDSLHDSLACCHLSLISQREGLEGIAVPCKLYGILASGRGIIGMVPERSEVGRVLHEENCGVVLKPDDEEGVVAEIKRLSSEREVVERMGEAAFSAYTKKYTVAAAADRFAGLWSRGNPSG